MRFTATLAALVALAIPALVLHAREAAADDGAFTIPDCAGLVEWAAKLDAKEPYFLTPRIKLQSVFAPEVSAPVFGIPTVQWTPEQAGEVIAAKKACGQALHKAKKRAEQKTLNGINVRLVEARLGGIAKQMAALAEIKQQLLASPASPELRAVLAAMEPPRYGTGHGLRQIEDRALRKSLTALSRSLSQIPAEAAAETLAALVAHQEDAALDRLGALQGEIEAVPASAEGLARIATLRLDARELAGLDGGDSLSALEQLADTRTQAILDDLGQGPEAAPIRLPRCAELANWALAADLRAAEQYGNGWIFAVMKDDSLVPLFGKSLAVWTDADLDLFARDRKICQAEAATAPADSEPGKTLAAAVRPLQQVGQILRANRATYVAYAELEAVLEGQRAEMAALDVAPESLSRLDAMMAEPALKKLPRQQYDAHAQAIQDKRQEITVALKHRDAEALLDKIAALPATTQSLAELSGLRLQLVGLATSLAEQQAYDKAVAERRAELGSAVLDAALAKLDQYDTSVEDLTGLQTEHRAIVQQLSGSVLDDAMARYASAYEAALARVADGALDDFRDYLADLPETQEGLDALAKSRSDILGAAAPAPALKPYAEALDARQGEIYAAVSKARLEWARKEIAKIPATPEGLAQLADADHEMANWDLPQGEKATLLAYVHDRRNEIATELLAEPIAGLDDFDDSLDDLKAMPEFARGVEQHYGQDLGHDALEPFFDAYRAKHEAVAEAVLPDWQDWLADLPDEPASLQAIDTGLRDIGASGDDAAPALKPYFAAAESRAVAIVQELSLADCEPIWSATGMDEDDARLDVLTHDGTTKLGLLACGLAQAGAKLGDFDGGSTVELELTTRDGIFVTTSLHEGEIGPDETALIGYAVEDANGERKLTVAEWKEWLTTQLFTGAERALMAQKAACDALMGKSEDELSLADLLTLTACMGGGLVQGSAN